MSFDGIDGDPVAPSRDRMFSCRFYDGNGKEIEDFSTEYYISDIDGLDEEQKIRIQAFDLLCELAYTAKYEAPLFLEDFLKISEVEIEGQRFSVGNIPLDGHANFSHATDQQMASFFHFYDKDLASAPNATSFFSAEPTDFEQKYAYGHRDDSGSPFVDMDF